MGRHNPLRELESLGQSVWIDFIRRRLIKSGELRNLIREEGVSGVTPNPVIFEKAISGSHDYDDSLRTLALENRSAEEIYKSLAVEDIQSTADELRPVYERTKGRDGFVSLEVSPRLARDTSGTIDKAREGTLRDLMHLGIDLVGVGATLENEGAEKFLQPFENLLSLIEKKRRIDENSALIKGCAA